MQPSPNSATASVYSRDPGSPYIEAPYISVVATARNDDHGGNLLGRMQVFVDAWINQAKRHQLPSELILVEWNPPRDRERLAAALRWPPDTGPCQVRIIEVPAELHARYRHAAALPLYQMIAKNVGIRRAGGEFILATNIDVVFSDELMEFLASRRLEPGRVYRIDRNDVMSDVPIDGTIDEQLSYCRSHRIRLCAREGTFRLTAEGFREIEPEDITRPESGVHFGEGWFPVERYHVAEPFRWIGNEAEVLVRVPPGGAVMELELEVGPGIERTPALVQVLDAAGALVADFTVAGRVTVGVALSPFDGSARRSFRLRTPDGGRPLTNDHRILNFRVFRCDWARPRIAPAPRVPYRLAMRQSRPALGRLLEALRKCHGFWSMFMRGPRICRRAFELLRRRRDDIFETGHEFWVGPGWYEMEHSGADGFRWAARDAQLAVKLMNGQSTLAMLVEPGPELGFQPFVLVVRTPAGEVIARAPVDGLTYVEFPLPFPSGTLASIFLSAEGGGRAASGDSRDLFFRVFACGTGRRSGHTDAPHASGGRWTVALLGSRPAERDWSAGLEQGQRIAAMGKPPLLHSNACGDFTLMSRELWFDVRGYAELDQFSMHLDTLLCYTAHYSGAREEVLAEPMRIYHIEHGIGSGWTPEGDALLNARIAQKGISSLTYEDVMWFITQVRTLRAPIISNLDQWGLADSELCEVQPQAAVSASTRSG
jgi:hypothetical protein